MTAFIKSTLLCLLLTLMALPVQAKTYHIAIVTDGSSDALVQETRTIKHEIQRLISNDFKIEFVQGEQFTGSWSRPSVKSALDRALSDPRIDIVIAQSTIASALTATYQPSKPLVAGFVFDQVLQGFDVTPGGGSGVENLVYIANEPERIQQDVRLFKDTVQFQSLGILFHASLYEALPSIDKKLAQIQQLFDSKISLISIQEAEEFYSHAATVDAVLVAPLDAWHQSQRERLRDILIEKHLPSFAFDGATAVKQGFLMGTYQEKDTEIFARRIALNVQSVLLGEELSQLPVFFSTERHLSLNMETARRIQLSPPFSVLNQADIVESAAKVGSLLSITDAVNLALRQNLSIAAAVQDVNASASLVKQNRGSLLPQLSVGLSQQFNNEESSFTGDTQSLQASLNLSQSIYSSSLRGSLNNSRALLSAQESTLSIVQLDIINQTAVAYLNVLIAQTNLDIRKDNLKSTLSNLELAKNRFEVGDVDRSEVLRLKTEWANAQQNTISARTDLFRANTDLNLLLNLPAEDFIRLSEPSISDAKIFGDDKLIALITNPEQARRFRRFLEAEALSLSPDIVQISYQVKAQEQVLEAARRAKHVPDVSLSANVSHDIDGKRSFGEEDSWRVGIDVSVPLLSGGRLNAALQREVHRLKSLKLGYDSAVLRLKSRTRTAVQSTGGAYNSIQFAEQAAESAKQTLDIVKDAYRRGTASDIDLIDAQNSALVADLAAANATYNFLIALYDLERLIGFFDFDVAPEKKQEWFQRFESFSSNSKTDDHYGFLY